MEMMVSFNNLKRYTNYISCLTSAIFKQSAKRSTIHNTLHFICIKYMILDLNSLGSKKIMVNKIRTCVCGCLIPSVLIIMSKLKQWHHDFKIWVRFDGQWLPWEKTSVQRRKYFIIRIFYFKIGRWLTCLKRAGGMF